MCAKCRRKEGNITELCEWRSNCLGYTLYEDCMRMPSKDLCVLKYIRMHVYACEMGLRAHAFKKGCVCVSIYARTCMGMG